MGTGTRQDVQRSGRQSHVFQSLALSLSLSTSSSSSRRKPVSIGVMLVFIVLFGVLSITLQWSLIGPDVNDNSFLFVPTARNKITPVAKNGKGIRDQNHRRNDAHNAGWTIFIIPKGRDDDDHDQDDDHDHDDDHVHDDGVHPREETLLPPKTLSTPRIIFYNDPFSMSQSGQQEQEETNQRPEYSVHLGRKIKNYAANKKWKYHPHTDPHVDTTPCVPMQKWQTTVYPTCNRFHEMSMLHDDVSKFLKGGWRYVWLYDTHHDKGSIILKTLKWTHYDFDTFTFEKHIIDAAASERLSSSPRVINIYGYCGMSVYNERADFTLTWLKRNNLSTAEKLFYGREVALAVAAIHDVDGEGNATIAHRDVKPPNLVVADGKIKIGDFNDARLLMWNTTSNRQCYFSSFKFPPIWDTYKPREHAQFEYPLTYKVDVYSMGAILYTALTGLVPFIKDEMRDTREEVRERVLEGVPPYIPSEYANSNDPSIQMMIGAIKQCFAANPDDRPEAREIAKVMDEALKLHLNQNQIDEMKVYDLRDEKFLASLHSIS